MHNPDTGEPWPAMPKSFLAVAQAAAAKAGFENFMPDGCLINGYAPGAKLTLHQDSDERDKDAPVVAISLGLPATFLFGGLKRSDPAKKVGLQHGDVVVWGRESRMAFHGIAPLGDGTHPLLGGARISLTFRKVT
jgi:alkylated DNA repair protein (DNA oxidative demethylase)